MKNKDCDNFDEMLNKGAWFVADMFKNFMNDIVSPVIEGKGKKESVQIRTPRPGEIIGTEENTIAKKSERYGIYAGSGNVIAILSETGVAGIIRKVGINEFLDGNDYYYVIDMEEFKDDIGINTELSENLDANGIMLEFVNDESSLAKANSIIGCETSESSSDAMFAMTLWCKTGLASKKETMYVKSVIGDYKTYIDYGKEGVEETVCGASKKSENEK